jgi:hypothetical protein
MSTDLIHKRADLDVQRELITKIHLHNTPFSQLH